MRRSLQLVLLICFASVGVGAYAMQQVSVADFSNLRPGDPLPAQWEAVTVSSIHKHTQYTLVSMDGVTVLQADAQASMSGIARKLDVDPHVTPWLQWRWRIAQPNDQSDLHNAKGDDFPARLYVFFDFDIDRLPFFERLVVRITRAIYGDQLPLAALCYVWANNDPPGTTAWNPHTRRVRTIVASSGRDDAGKWVSVQRDVSSEYRNAFGEPVPHVTGVAVATDSDDTGVQSLAWYGDIVFTDQEQHLQ